MGKNLRERLWARVEAGMAWLGHTFITRWGAFERGYRRPYARMARRLRFNWYPVLALLALSWLAWDWNHDRASNASTGYQLKRKRRAMRAYGRR